MDIFPVALNGVNELVHINIIAHNNISAGNLELPQDGLKSFKADFCKLDSRMNAQASASLADNLDFRLSLANSNSNIVHFLKQNRIMLGMQGVNNEHNKVSVARHSENFLSTAASKRRA